jgi:hypothetical protein
MVYNYFGKKVKYKYLKAKRSINMYEYKKAEISEWFREL